MQTVARRISAALAFAALLLGVGSAGSAVAGIYPTATLPPPNAVYATTGGAGCFVFAGVCVTPGALTNITPTSTTFIPAGEDIVSTGTFTTSLTDLLGHPIGNVALSGTFEQLVQGRTTATETGTFSTELLNVDFSGPFGGHTLMVGLDPSETSTGETSIVPVGSDQFKIDSFFDVFIELSLDTTPPLSTTRGPLTLTLVPEPATLALLGLPLLGLAGLRRRRT